MRIRIDASGIGDVTVIYSRFDQMAIDEIRDVDMRSTGCRRRTIKL